MVDGCGALPSPRPRWAKENMATPVAASTVSTQSSRGGPVGALWEQGDRHSHRLWFHPCPGPLLPVGDRGPSGQRRVPPG